MGPPEWGIEINGIPVVRDESGDSGGDFSIQ